MAVFSVRPPKIFQVQVKMPTIRSVFPDYLSVSYDYGENAVYSFINSMIEDNKYSSDIMKKHFNKELVMTKEDNEDFGTLDL